MPEDPRTTEQARTPDARALRDALATLRGRARTLLVVRRLGLVLGALVGAMLIGALIDAWLRFPSEVRVVAWLGALVLTLWALARWVLPAVRFCPSLTDVALRVEEARPETRGRLASALDLAGLNDRGTTGVGSGETHDALARRAVRDAVESFKATDALSIIHTTPAAKGASAALIALVLALVPLLLAPAMWSIGAQRILTPWSDAAWPKRTGVVDATALREERVHSLEESLAIRGLLTKWRGEARDEDVAVRYRTLDADGAVVRTQRALLTAQGRLDEGWLFERLIEPSGDALEYRLETDDDQTDWTRVTLVDAPAVTGATARITPPVYATGGQTQPGEPVDLGPGYDERAAAPTALAGSLVELEVTFNRQGLRLDIDGLERGLAPTIDTLRTALGNGARVETFEASETSWRVGMILGESTRLALPLVDNYGIGSVDTSVYRFDATPDRPASATITTPERDLNVLPGAVVEVEAEGRDDVGLARVALERQTWRRDRGSGPGGAMEAEGGFELITESVPVGGAPGEQVTARVVRASVDLSTLGLEAGDEVLLVALASDRFVDASGAVREPTRSSGRILRIIDEEAFVREVRDALAGVREGAIRLEQQQEALRESTRERGAERTTTRAQAQVAQRLEQRLEELRDIADRVEENRLDNDALSELLEEAQGATERAAQSASDAAQGLAEARAGMDPQETDATLPEDEARGIEDDQRRTEQELSDLIEMLDRGEDNWVVRNEINRLLEEQRALQQRTDQLGQETAGLTPEQLTDAQRRELEELVQEQQELAQETEELVDDLRSREQAMRESDPAGAEALRQAAQRAQQRQTSQTMERAAEQAQQNQTSEAQESQEEAAESLEEMLEDLDESERNRKEQLKRALFSLIQSIEALVELQEGEIALLEGGATDADTLARNMVRLADNTSVVSAEARATGPEVSGVANTLDRALDAQGDAIADLREDPADTEGALALERRSLTLLREALEAAQNLEQQIEQEQMEERRRELKRAYREALELQVTLRERTRPFAELDELSRRDRVRLRQLGPAQTEVGERLEEIRTSTQEMSSARVFEFAHRRMNRFSEGATGAMNDAQATRAVSLQDALVEALSDLLESLEDPRPEDERFQQDQQAGQGQGQGGQQQQQEQLFEDLAQLRLLREMQIMLAEETAALDGGAEALLGDLDAIAREQQELAGIAQELVEQITRREVPLEFLPENGGRPADPVNPLDDGPDPGDGEQGGDA
ncbi:MAG: hypothetical protein Tsb0013_11810 [Phycisphaerales bacterium]